MSRWFRLDDDVVNDPKVQRLPGDKFKAWINLLCLASKNEGVLPSLPDIAYFLRMDEEMVSALLDEFCRLLLIDPVEVADAPMSYEPHNWNGRQFKSDVTDPTAPDRMKRYRAKKRNDRNDTVTVTPTRTDTEQKQITEPEAEKKESRAVALSFDPNEFAIFWKAWPNRVGKPAAVKALASARKRGVPFDAIMAGIAVYIRDKPPDRSWMNPATFLNGNRWEDEPAICRGPPDRPLTEFQKGRNETRNILNDLDNYANGGGGGEADTRLLPGNSSERSEGLCSGSGADVIDLPTGSHRSSG